MSKLHGKNLSKIKHQIRSCRNLTVQFLMEWDVNRLISILSPAPVWLLEFPLDVSSPTTASPICAAGFAHKVISS